MALGPAEHRGEAGDPVGVHQRGIGRAQLLGDDHRALGEVGESLERYCHERAQQAAADVADVLHPGREVFVLHLGEGLGDLGQLLGHRGLGVDGVVGDALVDAAHEARIGQHQGVRVEQVAELLGGAAGQGQGLASQLFDLFAGARHGVDEAFALGLDGARRDGVLGHLEGAWLDDVGRADGDAGGDADAIEIVLARAFALGRRFRRHQRSLNLPRTWR